MQNINKKNSSKHIKIYNKLKTQLHTLEIIGCS